MLSLGHRRYIPNFKLVYELLDDDFSLLIIVDSLPLFTTRFQKATQYMEIFSYLRCFWQTCLDYGIIDGLYYYADALLQKHRKTGRAIWGIARRHRYGLKMQKPLRTHVLKHALADKALIYSLASPLIISLIAIFMPYTSVYMHAFRCRHILASIVSAEPMSPLIAISK